ncbi:MAG: hydrogenase maturation peptidase HycI [Halobacteriales archaeon]
MDELLTLDPGDRLVVVGVGSDLRGDDAAGVLVARRLSDVASDRLHVIEGGTAPENYTSVVKAFEPDQVLLVDAVEFGGDPGDVKPVDPEALAQTSFSSHAYPLTMLTDYLERETGATITLLGIQPASIDEGEELSDAVENGIERVGDEIATALSRSSPS